MLDGTAHTAGVHAFDESCSMLAVTLGVEAEITVERTDRFIGGTLDRYRVHRRSQIHGETGLFEGKGPILRGCAQPVE